MFDPKQIEWWYVNLKSRPDRNEHAKAEFAKHNLPVRRMEGFLPEEWPGKQSDVKRMWNRTKGAIGCYQSQLHCVRTVQGSDRVVGVCEDDVCFCDDFPARLEYIAEHVPEDWDIFWLGATFHCNPAVWHKDTIGRDVETTDDPRILRTYGIWSTYAYLVNGKSVRKILDLCAKHVKDSDGIDHLSMLYLQPVLNTYCFVPGCTWQYDNQSNIGDGITYFSGFQKLGPYVWSKRMEDFRPDSFDWAEANERR